MAARVWLVIAAAAEGAAALMGPTVFSSPAATFPWPTLDASSYYGFQPTTPAFDVDGNVYLSSVQPTPRCPQALISSYAVDATRQVGKLRFSVEVGAPGWCAINTAVWPIVVNDILLASDVPGGGCAAIVTFNAAGNGTAATATIVAAVNSSGAVLWSAVLPPGLSNGALVSNATAVAVLSGAGPNATATVLDAASGATLATHPLPSTGGGGCGTSLATVGWVAASAATDGSDVLWLDATSAPYAHCTLAWAVTGPRAGKAVWSGALGGAAAPAVADVQSTSVAGPQAIVFGPSVTLGSGVAGTVAAVSADTGAVGWNVSLPGHETFIAGASAAGRYVFVLASYAVWRGCASPVSTLYALNASNGAVLNALPLTRYPDIGLQPGGALLSATDPSSPDGSNALLWWRETHGWGSFDSQITAASFAGGYFLITTRYSGADHGTNIAHDDQGSNPVRGCPPTVDSPPGRWGSLLAGPIEGQLLVTDWQGLQVFTQQGTGAPQGSPEL